MTENEERMEELKNALIELVSVSEDNCRSEDFERLDNAGAEIMGCLDELNSYRAIGTIEEFKALKEKNTPMELAEHNFQDEVHHYLCPSCRSIVSCTQNYCEECGQALET